MTIQVFFKGKGTDRPDLPDTTHPITSSRLAPECVLLSWIPACAGMTTGCYSGLFITVKRQPGNRLAQDETQRPHRHSGESRNPVVYIIHSGLLKAGQNDHSSFCCKGKGTDRPDLPDTTQPITSSRLAPECVLLSWIPACAGMTTGCYSGLFITVKRQPGNRLAQAETQRPHRHSGESRNPVVYAIHSGLLEAGQNDYSSFCFKGKGTDRPDLPDTTQPITSSRLAPECVLLSWIPAFAGMTGIFVHCQTLNTLPSPSRPPRQSFPPPSSFRRKPESSGLYNTFRPAEGRPE